MNPLQQRKGLRLEKGTAASVPLKRLQLLMLVHNAAMAVFVADSRHSNGSDNYRGGDADDGGDGAVETSPCGCVDGDGDADADEAEDADEDAYKHAVGIMKGKMMRMRVRMGLQKETGTRPCKE